MKLKRWFVLLVLCVLFVAGTASADWDAPKWVQLPDVTTNGMDIRVDHNDGLPRILADDFLCTESISITDVHLWGSWKGDQKGNITNIHLSIHADVPDPDGDGPLYSMPALGDPLWADDFGPSQFTEVLYRDISPAYEWWWDPYYEQSLIQNGDQKIWQYNIYIDPHGAYSQEGTPENPIVYWLSVYVETDGFGEFGWKTSLQHWNDDAVWFNPNGWRELRYPGAHPLDSQSIDLAFVITPEPATLMLLGMGGLITIVRKRRSV